MSSKTSMMATEWVLGISDNHPKGWPQSGEPFDEQITATSDHSFYQLVHKLCETALAKRRGEDDSGIEDHLWNLKITTLKQAIEGEPDRLRRYLGGASDSDDSDDDDDDDESEYRGRILVAPDEHLNQNVYEQEQDDEYEMVAASEKLSKQVLAKNLVVKFTYDFGSTTTLYLKVLRVRPAGAERLLSYFGQTLGARGQDGDLEAVPAYKLPKEQQIDAFYPNFSKAFLGNYVPVIRNENEDEEDETIMLRPTRAIGSATLGLSSRVRSDKDTTFCTLENSDCSSDLLFASQPFEDMQEFLQVAEEAWTPRSPGNDPDHLERYRYGWISRHVFPSSADADEAYDYMVEDSKSEYAQFGPKRVLVRLKPDEKVKPVGFDFAKTFPKTHAQLQSGMFRWIKYKGGVLRVLVGRGTGSDRRGIGSEQQVLRTWNRKFESMHELLCAVEASWIYQNSELDGDTVISEFDVDLGPSNPGPKKPKVLGKKEDAVAVSKYNDSKKLVTSMAIAREAGDKMVLFSGHADGTLCKWCLAENKLLWTKQIYSGGLKDFTHYTSIGIMVQGTAGVAGIVVREEGGKLLLFTWSDAYDGYPEMDIDDRGPSKIKCWSGEDGSYVKSYACDVGEDEKEGADANPSIATVVFCRLYVEDEWVDSMVVGLHCLCQRVKYASDFSDYDITEAQELGEGNILPFYEHSNGTAMETWRGHSGIIRAMAVVPNTYLVSFSMQYGTGNPDAMILWSLQDPGVPLLRKDFWDPSRSLFKQNLTRLGDVSGISVSGSDILLAAEYGDRIAVVIVEEDADGCPSSITLRGYGNIGNRFYEGEGFHGRMASSGTHAVMANELSGDTWVFNIEGNAENEKLDRRDDGQIRYSNRDEYGEDEDGEMSKYRYSGRDLAVGKVEFPLFGGKAPKRKKRKIGMESGSRRDESDSLSDNEDFGCALWTYDDRDGLGKGGPVALALNGKCLVAGFSNGSIVRAPFLPEEFETSTPAPSGLTSCCSLPSDEWHIPILESQAEYEGDDDDDDDDGEEGGRGRRDCCIQ